MNANTLNVSIVAGWGSNDFDVLTGVVGRGRLAFTLAASSCLACSRTFKIGDELAIVSLEVDPESLRVYHADCLPAEYEFKIPLAGNGKR